jgi:hypothetical protein
LQVCPGIGKPFPQAREQGIQLFRGVAAEHDDLVVADESPGLNLITNKGTSPRIDRLWHGIGSL